MILAQEGAARNIIILNQINDRRQSVGGPKSFLNGIALQRRSLLGDSEQGQFGVGEVLISDFASLNNGDQPNGQQSKRQKQEHPKRQTPKNIGAQKAGGHS